ncbi:hypothetical protein, partial [Nocardiopsis sp. MG754419]|uniref:hypothetical protein n=1 Tax=Nocardiopsis sp. MG754419 TaxID=2259865 RepID=UPI001BA76FDA
MTVTVIIIIAVVVVLAVLVLLLLGMRALSLGSRDDYDDDHDYEDAEDDDRDDREDLDERPARGRRREEDLDDEDAGSRGRGRRSNRAERRPKGRRQRGVDWEDDDSDGLSDNDFWSSLSDEEPAQASPRSRRGEEAYGAGDADGYEDDYDTDYDDEPEHVDTRDQGPSAVDDTSDQPRTPRGSASDLAMLAGLGQSGTPEPPARRPEPQRRPESQQPTEQWNRPAALDSGPSPSALPPTQGLPPVPPAAPATHGAQDHDPLGTGWTPPPPSTGDPFEGREPLSAAERRGRVDGDPVTGGAGHHGGTGYESPGSYGTDHTPTVGGPTAADPLDPGFRPTSSGGDEFASPIWSSMDTGTHQRSDLGGYGQPGAAPAPGQPMGGPGLPGHPAPGSGADPLTGGHPSGAFQGGSAYDPSLGSTDAFTRSEYDTGTHGRPEYDTGAHQRGPYDTDAFGRPGH